MNTIHIYNRIVQNDHLERNRDLDEFAHLTNGFDIIKDSIIIYHKTEVQEPNAFVLLTL